MRALLVAVAAALLIIPASIADPAEACVVSPDPLSLSTWTVLTVSATGLNPIDAYAIQVDENGKFKADLVAQTDEFGSITFGLTPAIATLSDLEVGVANVNIYPTGDHDAGTIKNVPGNTPRAKCSFAVVE